MVVIRLVVGLVLISLSFANPLKKLACEAGPHTSVKIITKSIATVYNVFPIRIGGIKIPGVGGIEDLNELSSTPICMCSTPFPRIGIKISLWEPIAILEPVKVPWCTPSLPIPGGLTGKVPFNAYALGSDTKNNKEGNELRSLQVHYYRYLPWALLEMFMDFICMETRNPWDIGYMTEVDPLWQSDTLASILGPEVFLFANPIAQSACAADALASSVGFSMDPLFWCMGSWGSMYPMSQNVQLDSVQTAGGINARMLFKLHRELVLWGSMGEAGLCGRYPMPIMRKSQYNMFPVYPIAYPYRFPIGRTSWAWGLGREVPVLNRHNHAWMVYRKRDCCAF